MGLYSKYAALSVDEIYQTYIDLDKSKNPHQAIELKNELEHRRAVGEVPSARYNGYADDSDAVLKRQAHPELQAMPLVFEGSPREYFRIWIVNLCLTLLTFGIFSAWAKVRKKRYFYSHTRLGETPFQYLGRPVPILKGRLIAAAGFGLYYISSHFVISLFPYVLAAGLIAAPWVLVRSAAFNARYSAFRNMTFDFKGGYWDAVKVLYAWGILPAFAIAIMFNSFGKPFILIILSFVFSISLPWLICRIKKFIIENSFFGGIKGQFSAKGGQYFAIYFTSGLIAIALVLPAAVLMGILVASGYKVWLMPYLFALPTYAGYVIGYAYVRANSTNLTWNSSRIGPLSFDSSLKLKGLAILYLTNALGIIASCGLLIPWAVMRTLKYRIDHLRILQKGELIVFEGSEKRTVEALGAETLDLFDWDLSL